MREYFKKELEGKLENCTAQVRCRSEERCGNANTHLRWFEPVGPCGLLRVLGESPQPTFVLAASSSQAVCEGLGGGGVPTTKGEFEQRWEGSSGQKWSGPEVPRGCGDLLAAHFLPKYLRLRWNNS